MARGRKKVSTSSLDAQIEAKVPQTVTQIEAKVPQTVTEMLHSGVA